MVKFKKLYYGKYKFNLSMNKTYVYAAIIILLILISYVPVFTMSNEGIRELTKEDRMYENLQAIFFLLSAGLMLFLFIHSKYEGKNYFLNTNRNYWFLLLFLFFFFVFGEEISWGQRIFGIRTPENLHKINAQDETNIHNLWVFQMYDKNLNPKTGLDRWITGPRLFALSWILYCVIIPVLNYLSYGISSFFRKINLPIIPLWLGFLFVLAHIISKIAEKFCLLNQIPPINEIKETGFAFLYLVASILLLTERKIG